MAKHLSPHDRFTRSLMAHPKVAQEFFQENLPQHIRETIDFSSLSPESDSFIGDDLKLQVADLLYAANFNDKPGFLYLFIEHASKPDPKLPFRILKYTTAIMDRHLKAHKGNTLPFVYPMIFYTGKRPYKHSMDLFDLFEPDQRDLARETFTTPYRLIDLTQVPDEKLGPYLWFGNMALTLKHIHDLDILPFFNQILPALKMIEKEGEEGYIYTIVKYVFELGETLDQGDFLEAVKSLESVDEEKLMTLAEYLKPRVIEKVRKESIERGIEQGLMKGRLETAKFLLSEGMGLEMISKATNLPRAELKKLFS